MTKGLVALVESKTAITDLIGTSPTRFYPRMVPQGVGYPAATFRVVDTVPNNSFSGASTYDFYFVDIFSYAQTYAEVVELFDTIRSEIEETVGTFNSVQIDHVWFMTSGAEDWLEDLDIWTKQGEYKIAIRR